MREAATIDAAMPATKLGEATSGVPPSLDRRTLRRQRTHDLIIEACRNLMLEGALRPDSRSLADRCGVSNRTVFIHFPSLRDVYREALKDAHVLEAIERRVPQDRAGILRAVVLGELMPAAVGR